MKFWTCPVLSPPRSLVLENILVSFASKQFRRDDFFFFFKAMAWHFTRLFWEPSANCMTSRPVSSFGAKKKLRYILPVLHARTLKVTLKCHKSAFVLLQSSAKTNKQPPQQQTNKQQQQTGAPCVFTTSTINIFKPLLSGLVQRRFRAQSACAAFSKPQDGSEGVFEAFTCLHTCWSRKKWNAAAKLRVGAVRWKEMLLKRCVVDPGRI